MLKTRIEGEIKAALKKGDPLRLSVFRMLASAIHNKEIEKRTRSGEAREAALTEEETISVVRAELKKRKDASAAYQQGGRPDAAEREETEAAILSSLLPQELSDSDLEQIVLAGKAATGASAAKDFGKLMGWVMKETKGQASGDRASAMVKKHLAPLET